MKRNTLLTGILLALSAPAVAQWSDPFDTYAPNQSLFNVGGWTGWDNVAAAAGTVDASRSRSFPNSMRCGTATDAVHPALGITSGKWRLTAWQYVATSDLTGDLYFILNNRYNHGGPYSWSGEVSITRSTGLVKDDLRTSVSVPVVLDRWVEYRMDIDLDANTATTFYDGKQLSQGVYNIGGGPIAIENIDLFNNGGSCNWDDIALEWRGDAFERYAAATSLFNVGGWTGWDNTAAAAGTVDTTFARSAPNSVKCGPTTDAVHPNIGITRGRWRLTAWQYVPTGALTGDLYFILNNRYNHGGPYSWSGEVSVARATGLVKDDLRTGVSVPAVFDQWVEYRMDIDLDSNLVSTYYNGTRLSVGTYNVGGGPIAIANIDLFNNGGTCYWDDVQLQEITSAPCFEPQIGTALLLTDDARSVQNLGFTFPFQGGSTTSIAICSNGFIWLDSAQTSTDFSNSVAEFLGSVQATPRIAAAWRDFNPAATGSDDVYFNALPDRAVITWHNVTRFNGTSPMTVQCQMLVDGSVYVFYDTKYDLTGGTVSEGRTLIGIKAGVGNVADPGATDYSTALPISTTGSTVYEFFGDSANFDLAGRCIRFTPNAVGGYDVTFRRDCPAVSASYGVGCPAGTPITMTTDAPPRLGSTFNWNVTNLPAATTFATLLIGVNNSNIPLDGIGFVGCSSYTTMNLAVAMAFTPPTATLAGTVPVNPQIIGMPLYTQAAIVENTWAATYTSNGVTLVIGKD